MHLHKYGGLKNIYNMLLNAFSGSDLSLLPTYCACAPRFLSPSPFALALWWSAHLVPHSVSLLLFASVPVSSRCTLLKLHLALSLLVVACTFPSLTSHCRLACIGCLVHSLPLSVMVNAPSPHPPSTDCHPGIIVNSKFCHGRL